MFNALYKLNNEAELILSDNIYGLAAKNEKEAAIMLTHFNRWDNRNSNIGEYALNVFDLNLSKDVCLVIGSEGNGVSDVVREKANLTVKIPMENGMESLNASVSAGILMYALKRTNG